MTTCTIELDQADQPSTCDGRLSTCPIVASEEDWERGPCPMTGQNQCPSDAATQAKCPQC